jgi:hypothetical protein
LYPNNICVLFRRSDSAASAVTTDAEPIQPPYSRTLVRTFAGAPEAGNNNSGGALFRNDNSYVSPPANQCRNMSSPTMIDWGRRQRPIVAPSVQDSRRRDNELPANVGAGDDISEDIIQNTAAHLRRMLAYYQVAKT